MRKTEESTEKKANLGVDVGDFLNRTTLPRATVLRGNDASVCALAELLDELVLGVDDEGRVEGGEGVSLHGVRAKEMGEDGEREEREEALRVSRLSTRR